MTLPRAGRSPADTVRPRRALWPLPGSASGYTATLVALLRMAEDSPSASTYCERLQTEVPGVGASASGYLKPLTNVGLVETSQRQIRLTAAGRSLLEGRQSLLSELLVQRIAGVREILVILAEEPMRIGQLHARLQEQGFAWRTQSQIRYRLRWMEAAAVVRRVTVARYPQYALTPLGQRLLKKAADA